MKNNEREEKMKKGNFLSMVLPAVLCLLALAACDPTEEETKKSQNFDFGRTEGEVIAKSIEYFTGDNDDYGKARVGLPFYNVTIKNEVGAQIVLRNVPLDIFDGLDVGMELPQNMILTAEHLASLRGSIVDKYADVANARWYVVVDNEETIKVYRVSKEAYYRAVDRGIKLPLAREKG